jgi:prepilin-type N-terminal cleavage/methylation domain-containing protein
MVEVLRARFLDDPHMIFESQEPISRCPSNAWTFVHIYGHGTSEKVNRKVMIEEKMKDNPIDECRLTASNVVEAVVPHDPANASSGEQSWSTDNRDSGFTLVELLVVVVIMGVLATVSVLGVRGLTDRGQESACESDQRVMEVAVETWFADESLATSGTLTEAALVEAQLLRDESSLFDVQADGTVVPVVGGACDPA